MIQRPPLLPQRVVDLAQARVHHFDGLHRRLHFAGVPHHIGVGEIHHDHVEVALLNGVRSPRWAMPSALISGFKS